MVVERKKHYRTTAEYSVLSGSSNLTHSLHGGRKLNRESKKKSNRKSRNLADFDREEIAKKFRTNFLPGTASDSLWSIFKAAMFNTDIDKRNKLQ